MEKVSLRSDELKARWDSSNLRFDRDRRYDLSWPQRNYSCTFCKKQFKSAQALGGHMNIHRRDRARTRHDSPNSNPGPIIPTTSNPNPNPNFSSSPSATTFFPYISHYSSLTSSSLSWNPSPASSVVDRTKLLFKDHSDDHELVNNGGKLKSSAKKENKKNGSFLAFGLNMGLHKDVEEEEGLDLELRLGYS